MMDMELFILASTATDFTVEKNQFKRIRSALQIAAFALVAACAVGHFTEPPATTTQLAQK